MYKLDETILGKVVGRDTEKEEEIKDVLESGVGIPELMFLGHPENLDNSDSHIDFAISAAKNLISAIEGIKKYETELANVRKQLQTQADMLCNKVALDLEGDEWSSENHKVSYRASESLKITDESLIPDEFMKISAPTPDKTAIKKAIKSGQDVPGAEIEKKQNIQFG